MPYFFRPQSADQDPRRTRRPTCRACKQRIVYVPTAKSGGAKFMPCQPHLEYGDGKKTLVVLDDQLHGHVIVKAPPEMVGRQPHFGRLCPEGVLDQLNKALRNP